MLSSYHMQTHAHRVLAKLEPFGRSPWSRFSQILTFPRVTPRETLRSDIPEVYITERDFALKDVSRSPIHRTSRLTMLSSDNIAIIFKVSCLLPRYILHPNTRRVYII